VSKKEEKQRENSQYDLLSREKLLERRKLKQREKNLSGYFHCFSATPRSL
jgi:hypothetical protein